MDLLEMSARGQPMVVEVAPDMHRIAVAVFRAKSDGAPCIGFCDVFWPYATFHPFHCLPGDESIEYLPPDDLELGVHRWLVGGQTIVRLLDHGDPKATEYGRWLDWLAEEKERTGKDWDYAAALAEAHKRSYA